jgi:GntR family transcriptional regulator
MNEAIERLAAVELDPSSPVPVYYQLFEALSAQLGNEPFLPGSKLPTERAIAERLGISRQTVRHAFGRLERDGLVFRRQGDGTYVSQPRVEGSLRFLSGFTSELSQRGVRVRSRVLDLRLVTPSAVVAAQLELGDARDSAVMLRRVRSLDGTPAVLETVWLPADLCSSLLQMRMEDRSLYSVLRDALGLIPHRATERLSATILDEFEANELDRRPGDPALLVERSTRDADGRPIEAVKSLLRADRFSFTTELDLE